MGFLNGRSGIVDSHAELYEEQLKREEKLKRGGGKLYVDVVYEDELYDESNNQYNVPWRFKVAALV